MNFNQSLAVAYGCRRHRLRSCRVVHKLKLKSWLRLWSTHKLYPVSMLVTFSKMLYVFFVYFANLWSSQQYHIAFLTLLRGTETWMECVLYVCFERKMKILFSAKCRNGTTTFCTFFCWIGKVGKKLEKCLLATLCWLFVLSFIFLCLKMEAVWMLHRWFI